MKITRVECFILNQQFPFVKVHTDAGITGIAKSSAATPQSIRRR
jgi:hypothetical protein